MDRELVNIASYMAFSITALWFLAFPLGGVKVVARRIKSQTE